MTVRRRAPALILAALVAGLAGAPRAETARVDSFPVDLNPSAPSEARAGRLTWRGGLRLASADRRFGGWSALQVSADGRAALFVSDQGRWLTARLDYDAAGLLAGLAEVESGPLVDTDGRPLLRGGAYSDAESLAALPDGRLVVAFEHVHRLWAYSAGSPPFQGTPLELTAPSRMTGAPGNDGMEALTALPDGRLLIVTEGYSDAPDTVLGWIGGPLGWSPLRVAVTGGYRPTGAASLDTGEVFLVERRFNPIDGLAVRIRRFAAREIAAGGLLEGEVLARLAPPLTVDNFEGIAVRRGTGETLIYLLSDNNIRRSQRTLLTLFALPD